MTDEQFQQLILHLEQNTTRVIAHFEKERMEHAEQQAEMIGALHTTLKAVGKQLEMSGEIMNLARKQLEVSDQILELARQQQVAFQLFLEEWLRRRGDGGK